MESRRISHELARVLQALWFLLVSGVCLWGIVESLCSLSQVLGWRSSRHALYALTGHFQNPGPFGGFIACVMAVAAKTAGVVTILAGIVAIPKADGAPGAICARLADPGNRIPGPACLDEPGWMAGACRGTRDRVSPSSESA